MAGRSNSIDERQRRFDLLIDDGLFTQLWRHADSLTLVREDAEDLLQETLVAAFQKLDQLRDARKLRPWLMSILRSRFLNHVRSIRRHQARKEVMKLVLAEDGPDDDVEAVSQALQQLPGHQRWLLTSHYIEGISTAELAAAEGTTTSNIRQRLHRARRALLDALRSIAAGSTMEVA